MPITIQETVARVEFRWRRHEEEFARRLADAAREAGRSGSDHARELMKDALTRPEQEQQALAVLQQDVAQLHLKLRELENIKQAIQPLYEHLYQIRDDLATAVAQVLSEAGRMSAADARDWVQRTLGEE